VDNVFTKRPFFFTMDMYESQEQSMNEVKKSENYREKILPIITATLGNTVWGFCYPFTKIAFGYAEPEVILSMRFTVAFLMLNFLILIGKGKVSFKGKNMKPVILLAATELMYFYFESYGILYTNATFAGVMLAVVPVVSIFVAILFLKEYPTRKQAIYCLLPVTGVIIMTISGSSLGIIKPIGVFLLMCCCLSSAVYKTANRKAAEEFTPFERTYILILACAVGFSTMAIIKAEGDLSVYAGPVSEPTVWFCIIMLSVLGSLLANTMVNHAAGHMSVVKLSTFGTLTTLVSAFTGIVFLHEPVSAMILVGAIFIIFGIWKVNKSGK